MGGGAVGGEGDDGVGEEERVDKESRWWCRWRQLEEVVMVVRVVVEVARGGL